MEEYSHFSDLIGRRNLSTITLAGARSSTSRPVLILLFSAGHWAVSSSMNYGRILTLFRSDWKAEFVYDHTRWSAFQHLKASFNPSFLGGALGGLFINELWKNTHTFPI